MEAQMKLTIPAILITALMVAPPAAFAQSSMGYKGTTSNPATSATKDDSTSMTKKSKKMASHKKKSSKSQTTGSGGKY
jgi:hypothetical protein